MKLLSPICIITLALLLTACGSIMQNHDKRYLEAKSIPQTRIPSGVSSVSFHTEYPTPDRASSDAAKEVSLVPPGLYN